MEQYFHGQPYQQQLAVTNRSNVCRETSATETPTLKRPRVQTPSDTSTAGAAKRVKSEPEEPSIYSDNVRKKLAATSRTGQACDRCKERKMKCDTDPVACQPCRAKGFKCFTTDRVSGKARQRGDQSVHETEVAALTARLAYYEQKYGAIPGDVPSTPLSTVSQGEEKRIPMSTAVQLERRQSGGRRIPSATYIGWPLPKPEEIGHRGPVHGTSASCMGWGVIECSDFSSEMVDDLPEDDPAFSPFTFSSVSMLRTINQRQRIEKSEILAILPSKEEALKITSTYLFVTWNFVPITHRDSFIRLVNQYYDSPEDISHPEELHVLLMLATLYHQAGIRNQGVDNDGWKIPHAYKFYHYCLGFYADLMQNKTLPAMQALAMILVLMRNLPKPGCAWRISQEMLMRCLELDYHRDPDKVDIPLSERNPLSKELRKRVFHSIYGMAVTTGHRLGKPSPWQNLQWDVPLPMALKDSELTVDGIQEASSGRCDFWACIQLAKLLPISTELFDHVLTSRKPPEEHIATVTALHQKIEAWRADWYKSIEVEDKNDNFGIVICSLLIDSWHAEFLCNMYHPLVCTAPQRMDKHLGFAYQAAKRMLKSFYTLARDWKAADYTWHSTVALALGFGLTLHFCRTNSADMTQERFDNIHNELSGWVTLIGYADVVCGTDGTWGIKFKALKDELTRHILSVNSHLKLPARTSISNGTNGISNDDAESHRQQALTPQASHDQQHQNQQLHSSSPWATNGMPQSLPVQQYDMQAVQYHGYPPPGSQYPALPTSLATLLNEQPLAASQQNHGPTVYIPDSTGMFAPQIYTGPGATWPLAPNGGSFS